MLPEQIAGLEENFEDFEQEVKAGNNKADENQNRKHDSHSKKGVHTRFFKDLTGAIDGIGRYGNTMLICVLSLAGCAEREKLPKEEMYQAKSDQYVKMLSGAIDGIGRYGNNNVVAVVHQRKPHVMLLKLVERKNKSGNSTHHSNF